MRGRARGGVRRQDAAACVRQAEARGNAGAARTLRAQALDAAPATAGTLDGEPFEWIADADSRLGPVLEAIINGRYCWVPFAALTKVVVEAPSDLRDLVWAPAQLEFPNGGSSVALLPVRYAGSAGSGDAALQMARRTDWLELGEEQYRGLGQRVLNTDTADKGLLDVRELVLAPTASSDDAAPA
jgi:type VI secretion system protein ImpE